MDKPTAKPRYVKVTIITLVVAAVILGAVLGGIHAGDRMDMDIRRLTTTVRIADAMHVKVVFQEGAIVVKRQGVAVERTVTIPTLKGFAYKENSVQLAFRSFLFRKTIDLEMTDALKIPRSADE